LALKKFSLFCFITVLVLLNLVVLPAGAESGSLRLYVFSPDLMMGAEENIDWTLGGEEVVELSSYQALRAVAIYQEYIESDDAPVEHRMPKDLVGRDFDYQIFAVKSKGKLKVVIQALCRNIAGEEKDLAARFLSFMEGGWCSAYAEVDLVKEKVLVVSAGMEDGG